MNLCNIMREIGLKFYAFLTENIFFYFVQFCDTMKEIVRDIILIMAYYEKNYLRDNVNNGLL